MPTNETSLSDPNVTTLQWVRANCKLTLPGFFTWLAPWLGMYVFGDWWRFCAVPCILIGIWRSNGTWRKLIGAVYLIGVLGWGRAHGYAGYEGGVMPWQLETFAMIGAFATWYADGQEKLRQLEGGGEEWR